MFSFSRSSYTALTVAPLGFRQAVKQIQANVLYQRFQTLFILPLFTFLTFFNILSETFFNIYAAFSVTS